MPGKIFEIRRIFSGEKGEVHMVTRKDIAERAQVSVSVVSRALNNSGYVDAEKREQILKIADELG